MLAGKKIAFLGAGAMAEALIAGLLKKRLLSPEQLAATNKANQERLKELQDKYGIRTHRDKAALIGEADILILAMKPKDVAEALREAKPFITERHLLVSVIAGVSTSCLTDLLGKGVPIVRSMPNTSCTIGMSATALAAGAHANETHLQIAQAVFSAVGSVTVVAEEQLDIVTGLSGSGPAYIYYMVEAMEQAAIEAGLDARIARQLTRQTLLGAARMLTETGEEPAVLRQRIMSPGGTTVAGLGVLEERDFPQIVRAAIHRAAERSRELGASFASSLSDERRRT
ncbi:pyrroline-5-carboxylate reductase ProI [Bacillaceae bacterium]